jgi:hypothetical protein
MKGVKRIEVKGKLAPAILGRFTYLRSVETCIQVGVTTIIGRSS